MPTKVIGHLWYHNSWEFFKSGMKVKAWRYWGSKLIDGYANPQYSHNVCDYKDWNDMKKTIESGRYYNN